MLGILAGQTLSFGALFGIFTGQALSFRSRDFGICSGSFRARQICVLERCKNPLLGHRVDHPEPLPVRLQPQTQHLAIETAIYHRDWLITVSCPPDPLQSRLQIIACRIELDVLLDLHLIPIERPLNLLVLMLRAIRCKLEHNIGKSRRRFAGKGRVWSCRVDIARSSGLWNYE